MDQWELKRGHWKRMRWLWLALSIFGSLRPNLALRMVMVEVSPIEDRDKFRNIKGFTTDSGKPVSAIRSHPSASALHP